MARRTGSWNTIWRRWWVVVCSAMLASLLTFYVGDLPQFSLVQASMNDENFTDIVLKTRGELPIDTNIRVLTYDRAIFDTFDRVDRAELSLRLAALLDLKPRLAAVDFLIEDERPEAPEGDEMLAALIETDRNLIFGIFHEDSLGRFRRPPPRFNLLPSQLGCINVREDGDRTIRTYSVLWGNPDSGEIESFDLKIARGIDSAAAAEAVSHRNSTFIIDYAGGIGEESEREISEGAQIFPVMPLETVYQAVISGDSSARETMRRELADKAVLVGYADIRNSQVTSIVDRFYTPLKPEKNALPDMHGIAIHANVVNSIVQRRIVQVMPAWANFLWAFTLVFFYLLLRGRIEALRAGWWRKSLLYGSFILSLLLAVMLPVLAYRYTIFKFSIYAPFSGILMAVPTVEALTKLADLLRDLARRRRAGRLKSRWLRSLLLRVLTPKSADERYQQAIHTLHLQFHTPCALLFHQATEGKLELPAETIAQPTPGSIAEHIGTGDDAALDPAVRLPVRLLRLLTEHQSLLTELKRSRALYVVMTEVRRQNAAAEPEAKGDREKGERKKGIARGYIDLALAAMTGSDGDRERFDQMYRELENLARLSDEIIAGEPGPAGDLIPPEEEFHPYLIRRRCRLHGVEETFVYFHEQVDANNRDDFHDIVYGGATIRCEPEDHPGLSDLRAAREEKSSAAVPES